MALSKIVSGGQTGVDRGALDAALVAGFACGGWCPAHRGAEDGEIPERYPLTSLPLDFTARMRRRTQGREASQSHVFDSLSPGERTGEQHCCEHTDAMSGQVRSETMDGESVAVRTARPDGELTARQVGEQYRARTLKNVQASDGTVILFSGSLSGGTLLTQKLCLREKKPFITVNAKAMTKLRAADAVEQFIEENQIQVLNVAGPRLSGWPQGYTFALGVIGAVISNL
jgi:Circularly permutated YpsA SLOG family